MGFKGGNLLRELSMLDPSGEGKGDLSKTVILVLEYSGLWVSAYAVARPKTPDPTIRIEEGAVGMACESSWARRGNSN